MVTTIRLWGSAITKICSRRTVLNSLELLSRAHESPEDGRAAANSDSDGIPDQAAAMSDSVQCQRRTI
jgi:hypothetical protein